MAQTLAQYGTIPRWANIWCLGCTLAQRWLSVVSEAVRLVQNQRRPLSDHADHYQKCSFKLIKLIQLINKLIKLSSK